MYNDAIRMGSEKDINIKKHGIDFSMASKVFDDPNFVLIKDASLTRLANSAGTIGATSIDEEAALLVVVHVYRGQNEEEIIRIISARGASKRERRLIYSISRLRQNKRQYYLRYRPSRTLVTILALTSATIPELTAKQLASPKRPARQLVAARLDRDVIEWLQSFGPGYSSRINSILRSVMEHQQR